MSPRFQPGGRFCEPGFGYCSFRKTSGREGEKYRPLDHMLQIPSIQLSNTAYIFIYRERSFKLISSVWFVQVCLIATRFVNYTCAFVETLIARFRVIQVFFPHVSYCCEEIQSIYGISSRGLVDLLNKQFTSIISRCNVS